LRIEFRVITITIPYKLIIRLIGYICICCSVFFHLRSIQSLKSHISITKKNYSTSIFSSRNNWNTQLESSSLSKDAVQNKSWENKK